MNIELRKKIKQNWDNIIKPIDSLGDFEDLVAELGAVLEDERVNLFPATLITFCADNGVIKEGVAQSDESVTLTVAKSFANRNSCVCLMADEAGIDIYPVNIGMKLDIDMPGIKNNIVAKGTKDFYIEKAMTKKEMEKAFLVGADTLSEVTKNGAKCVLLGEMGIGNTTTSAAVISALLKVDANEITGRGAGLNDEGLLIKKRVINESIKKYNLFEADAKEVLSCVGGFDICGMVGVILKAVELSVPVILDGLITAAAALAACKIDERAIDYIFFTHEGKEKGVVKVADYLGKKTYIKGNLALGEGSGAVAFMALLKNIKTIYDTQASFEERGMEAYKRF
ncbi:MAG: nicotinate-nucleotide--dimethylbenzimidazole phosphoribosyltransferase [Lachnospiraceae bacterium]|nr:nicotinate-nucleotide--dimethylbenzimidazole phosphoribosyltransferase [Lachnospiraceae bacterium]